jgi:preprotein translocase subunit SecD
MKTFVYLIIFSFIAVSMTSYAQRQSENFKSVILQANISNTSLQVLKQSEQTISARLTAYGLTMFSLGIIEDKGQIKVQLPGNLELTEIEGLLTSKGGLALYETLTLNGIADLIKSDSKFSSTDARIGCSGSENPEMKAKVEEYLKANNLYSSCKLFWGTRYDKSLTCLYALKVNPEGKPLLNRSDIESINSSQNKDNSFKIEIKFLQKAIKIWANATTVNLNKPIAIVIDDKVFYTPVVKSTIESGLCEITGSLTQKEVSFFLALVNNGQLPLDFKLLR